MKLNFFNDGLGITTSLGMINLRLSNASKNLTAAGRMTAGMIGSALLLPIAGADNSDEKRQCQDITVSSMFHSVNTTDIIVKIAHVNASTADSRWGRYSEWMHNVTLKLFAGACGAEEFKGDRSKFPDLYWLNTTACNNDLSTLTWTLN